MFSLSWHITEKLYASLVKPVSSAAFVSVLV
jgi:hypothetical protein